MSNSSSKMCERSQTFYLHYLLLVGATKLAHDDVQVQKTVATKKAASAKKTPKSAAKPKTPKAVAKAKTPKSAAKKAPQA